MSDFQLYLIHGDIEYRVESYARELVEKLVPAADWDFGLETVDGRVTTIEDAKTVIRQATEAVKTTSFLGGGKTVWIRNVSFLGGPKLEDLEGLKDMVAYLRQVVSEEIPQGHHFVISGSEISGNNIVVLAAKKLASAGRAELTVFKTATNKRVAEQEAVTFVAEQAAKAGCKLPMQICRLVVQRVGTDLLLLAGEVDKLVTYAGGKTPTEADIATVVTPAREAVPWDLLDAFSKKRLAAAIVAMHRLIECGVSVFQLMAQLHLRINELLVVRDSLDRQMANGSQAFAWSQSLDAEESEIVKALDRRWNPAVKHQFVQQNLIRQSRLFRRIELRWARQCFNRAQERMVSSGALSPEAILELALIDALSPPKPA